MSGRGPAPKDPAERRRRNKPAAEWQATPGFGWQHGPVPPAPVDTELCRETWTTWMTAWFAAHWTPADLPGLSHLLRLYAACADPAADDDGVVFKTPPYAELRQLMDTYGITPKGQQDRRWKQPAPPDPEQGTAKTKGAKPAGRYAHLRVVGSS